jgi:LmbE family N-acetylglucosaminyl deacetylase
MIQPLIREEEWFDLLRYIPEWKPPMRPTVVVAPHPDDETLGLGGFIAAQTARGVDVTIAAVTDGQNAYPDTARLGEIRRNEQTRALARLGVPEGKIVRFGLADSDVQSHEGELLHRLMRLVSSDTLLVAPWRGDFHSDHLACGRAAERVARITGAALISYFFWTWHMVRPELLIGLQLRAFHLPPKCVEAKAEALQEHRSQLVRADGNPILHEKLLGPAKRPFEVFSVS